MAVLDIIINAIDNASKVIEGIGDKGSSAMKTLVDNSKAIGAGMTAAGGAIVMLTDSAKKTNAALGVTGLQIGATKDEMRELALATTDATFPLDDVVSTFDLLARAGITSKDELQEIGSAMSDLGTATGNSANYVAQHMIPALNAFNIPLNEFGEHTDTIMHLLRNTTIEMSDFSSTVNRLSPDLDMLGIDLEDTAAILEVLAAKGVQGSAATREFRTAISKVEAAEKELAASNVKVAETEAKLREEREKLNEITENYRYELSKAGDDINKQEAISRKYEKALKDQEEKIADTEAALADYRASVGSASNGLEAFYKELGITADEVATYKQQILEAKGMTRDFADAAAEELGMVDQLKQKWTEWTLIIGSALEPLDGVGAVMTALGPIIMGIGPAMQTLSAIQTGTLIPSLTATAAAGWAAIAPWLPLVAAITAVIAIGWLLYDNWEEIAEATRFIWEPLLEFFTGLWDGITKIFQGAIDFVMGLLFPGESIPLRLEDVWSGLKDFFSGLWDNIVGIFENSFDLIIKILFPPLGLYELIRQNWGPITDFVGNLWDNIVKFFSDNFDLILSILFPPKGLYDLISDNWGGIPDFVGRIWDWIVQVFQNGFDLVLKILFPQVGLVELIQSNWGLIPDAIQGIWDSVVWIFRSFYSTAASYGRDIVFGLWDGIFSLFSWIHDQITGFGESILGWFTDGLGALWPHSPSEAGVKIGSGMAAGINKGLHDSMSLVDRAISDLEDAMRVETGDVAISSSARPLLQPVSGKAPMQVVEEHIHYHLDGTYYIREEADIRKVAIELERLRSTKARARGVASW